MNFYVTLEIDGQTKAQQLSFTDLMALLAMVNDSVVPIKIEIKGEK